MTTSDHHTSVLVVGGGITGLSTALFLARLGVRPTLVERHPSTAIMPQARAFNPRSMEIYRALGMEERIRERQSILADLPEMIGADTLAGQERFRVDLLAQVRPATSLSPTDWALIDQDELERVVRADAERAGADVRFHTELTRVEPDPEGVTAVVTDRGPGGSGVERRIRADYLVAADGNRAFVRNQLGVPAGGPGVLSHVVNVLFEADLGGALRGRRFLLAYLDRPTSGTALVPFRDFGSWVMGMPYHPENGETLAGFTEERCVRLVREAVGDPELDLTLVAPMPELDQKVTSTLIGAWVADRYRVDRVFFVGDAAHTFPPTGSFGANTGIADAHNLAWKLAAVTKGQAGAALLDTYHDERHPVAVLTLDQAMQRMRGRFHGGGDDAASIDDLTMIFGYRYDSSAVLTETPAPGEPVENPRTPSGSPGLRAPHVWLDRDGSKLSTLDLFTGSFTLLVGPDGAAWASAAKTAAASLGIDVNVHHIDADARNRWEDAYGVTATGAALVRPDGFVAWRARTRPGQPERKLEQVLRRLLARDG